MVGVAIISTLSVTLQSKEGSLSGLSLHSDTILTIDTNNFLNLTMRKKARLSGTGLLLAFR